MSTDCFRRAARKQCQDEWNLGKGCCTGHSTSRHTCNCIAMSSVVFEADNTWSEASVDGASVLPCAGCRRTWEAAKLAWCIVLYTYTRLLHIVCRMPAYALALQARLPGMM